MSEYLDTMHSSLRELRGVSSKLDELSGAAWTIGNERLSETLYKVSRKVEESERVISDAMGAELDRSLKAAQESHASTIEGVMAGIKLGKEDKT